MITLPTPQQASGTTPLDTVGAIRWVLIAVLIAGGGCAATGTVLRARLDLLMPRRRKDR